MSFEVACCSAEMTARLIKSISPRYAGSASSSRTKSLGGVCPVSARTAIVLQFPVDQVVTESVSQLVTRRR